MKKLSLILSATLLLCVACNQQTQKKEHSQSNDNGAIALETSVTPESLQKTETKSESTSLQESDISKLSEAFGHFLGQNLKATHLKFDFEKILQGMRNGFAGNPAPMSDKEYEELMHKFQDQAFTQVSSQNLKAAEEFLAKNANESNIIELVPGKLQYQVLTAGEGEAVVEHGTPQIKYTGKFLDGSVFGSSEEAGGAISVPLDQTIPGFSKGMVGMKEGEKRKLFVHPELGYGTTGHLPPNSLLIFEVEVIKAKSPDADKAKTSENDEDDLDDLSMEDPFDNDEEDTQ